MANQLKKYQAKRNFRKTTEPSGKKLVPKKSTEPLFVIQKHAARRLHYDLRLEVNGVLKSWAVPKGPSINPEDKRLAIQTEDHPYDYKDFEGIIPPGQYGAGKVIVWDNGIYRNLHMKNNKFVSMEDSLKKGHLIIWFEGEKMKGAYSLIRTRIEDGKSQWLLVKMKDGLKLKAQPVEKNPESVISGKRIEEIRAGRS